MRWGQFDGYLVPPVHRHYSHCSPSSPMHDHIRAKLPFGVVFPWEHPQGVPWAAAIRDLKPEAAPKTWKKSRRARATDQCCKQGKAAQASILMSLGFQDTHFRFFTAPDLGGISCCLPAFHIQVSYPASTRQHSLGLAGDCVRSQPVSSFYQPPSRPAERLCPLHVPLCPCL